MTCIDDVGAQLTFKSVRDEFNRERDGSAAGNGLGIQTDLRSAVKKKRRGRRQSRHGEGEGKEGETGVEERGKMKVT